MSKKVLDALLAKFPAAIEKTESLHGDEIAWVKKDHLVGVATWLRDDPAMAFDSPVFLISLTSISAVPATGRTFFASLSRWSQPSGSFKPPTMWMRPAEITKWPSYRSCCSGA